MTGEEGNERPRGRVETSEIKKESIWWKNNIKLIDHNYMPNSHNLILDSGALANYITPNTPHFNK